MQSILSLLSWILFGDFGLLTLTPRYLFGVLFPVMIFVGFLAEVFRRPRGGHMLPLVVGLGCTTAALASLGPAGGVCTPGTVTSKGDSAGGVCTSVAADGPIKASPLRRGIVWLLVLLIPCSSQIAIIASFAAIVTLRVFLTYLFFAAVFGSAIFVILSRIYPLTSKAAGGMGAAGLMPGADGGTADGTGTAGGRIAGPRAGGTPAGDAAPQAPARRPGPAAERRGRVRPAAIVREAFLSVTSTIPSFCVGSVIISTLTYFGVMDIVCEIFAPWLQVSLGLPKQAASLFILNLFKRDFGSASLLSFAEAGAFDATQLVIVMVMLTFCVPCFNTTVLLYKQEKLPMASLIWMGSLCVSLLFGRLVATVFFVCAV